MIIIQLFEIEMFVQFEHCMDYSVLYYTLPTDSPATSLTPYRSVRNFIAVNY